MSPVAQLDAYRRPSTPPELPEPVPTLRESVSRLTAAVHAFGREVVTYALAWLREHRLGYVERANFAGYIDGYRDGLNANLWRSR